VKTNADKYASYATSTGHGLFNFISIDDLKRP